MFIPGCLILLVLLVIIILIYFTCFNKNCSKFINTSSIKIFGLMLTRDDMAVLPSWCEKYASLFDKIWVLDGSENQQKETRDYSRKYNLEYYHDSDFTFNKKTDHSLRRVIFIKMKEYIKKMEITDNIWVMLIHPDEFYIDNIRDVVNKAIKEKQPLISYYVLHNMPHTNEKEKYKMNPVIENLQYFIHNAHSTPTEQRIFKYSDNLHYDEKTHSKVIPHGITNFRVKFKPAYLHYKVIPNLNMFNSNGKFLNSHWSQLTSHYPKGHRFNSLDDFFIKSPGGKYTNYKYYIKGEELPKKFNIYI